MEIGDMAMSIFEYTEEQNMLRDTIRKFIDNEYPAEAAREIDKNDRYPRELIKKLAGLGVLGITAEEKYGGSGRDLIGAYIISEELARRSVALSWTYCDSVFFGSENISQLGNEDQKKEYIPRLVNGEIVFCYGLTEPNAGSDTAAIRTFAERNGNVFVINGSKTFISGASECEYILLLTRTDRSVAKHKGLSFFIVDTKSDGYSAKPIEKIGVHGSDTCEVVLENVRVPEYCALGGIEKLNGGWKQLLSTIEVEHIHVAAEGVGMAQGALEEILRYVKERTQFGKPIGSFQSVQHQIADLATEVLNSRLLTYYSADLAQQGKPCWMESAMAKLYATETAKKVSLAGVQLHGGYGYTMEYDIQRFARDSLVMTIGGGTSEIQRNLIAKSLGL